jgi:hypothetical protein
MAAHAALAMAPSLAHAARSPGRASDAFRLRGSHGYELDFDIGPTFSHISVSSSRPATGLVSYAKLGSAAPGGSRTVVRFGKTGLADYRFIPSGGPKMRKLSPRCSGRPAVTIRGTFVGTFQFHGEDGYTEVRARRAKGTREFPAETRCTHPARHHRQHHVDHGRERTIAVFSAGDPTDGLALSAIRFPGKPAMTLISADQRETREGMQIGRSVFLSAPTAGAFTFDPGLGSATLAPGAPFSGSATYTRLDDYTTRWEGPLAVAFPGMPEAVPLTGPKFSWSLYYERESTGGVLALYSHRPELQIIH